MHAVPRYAVFGHPVGHSLSPRLHAAFAVQTGVALEYTAIDAPPERFAEIVHAHFNGGGHGANVTLPDKRLAFELADTHTRVAQRAGVANVLTRLPGGRIEAHNTDGTGLMRDLRERHCVALRGARVLLLGAGGAAQATAWALLDEGVNELVIANRTTARALALSDALAQPRHVCVSEWNALGRSGSFDLILNATSAGVRGEALPLPSSLFRAGSFACDLAYGAAALPFIAWAREAGARMAIDGLGMLAETAADSFERWHGVRPGTDAALHVLREAADQARK